MVLFCVVQRVQSTLARGSETLKLFLLKGKQLFVALRKLLFRNLNIDALNSLHQLTGHRGMLENWQSPLKPTSFLSLLNRKMGY